MATFPVLKTGAVMQYPVSRTLEYSTQVLRFVDGSEQRFREYKYPIRKWRIRLDLLDEEELARVEEFCRIEQGRAGKFSFTDPWDAAHYPSCSLENDFLETDFRGPGNGRTELVIRQNVD